MEIYLDFKTRLLKATDDLKFELLRKNDAEKRNLSKFSIDKLDESVQEAQSKQMDILMEVATAMDNGTLPHKEGLSLVKKYTKM